jgi:hypothetical protein
MALSDKDRRGFLLMGVAAAIVIVLVAARLALDRKPKPGADGCISPIVAETVVIVDHSESLTEQTKNEITARVMSHVDGRVKTNERVSVFYVTELSKKSLVPSFSRCKPPKEGNRAFEDVKKIQKVYQQDFIVPLRQAVNAATTTSNESPIAQAIIDISLSQYLRGAGNSLLVFSDMLENTPKFSLYKCSDAQAAISQFRQSRTGAQERPKFSKTSISLNIIPRPEVGKSTLKCRDQVWSWFFGDNEGAAAGLETSYLPGG